MYFDPRPKVNRKDFFDREDELKKFREFALSSPLFIIKGLRRTGKTSLLLTALNSYKLKGIVFDCGRLPSEGLIDKRSFLLELCNSIDTFIKRNAGWRKIFIDILQKVKGISFYGISVEFDDKKLDFIDIFEKLNDIANKKATRLLLIFDEAQELRRFVKYRMDKIFAYIYDNLKNLCVVLTGSEVGLLYQFLQVHNPEAPLYGRVIDEINLLPLSHSLAKKFLIKGYRQFGISPSEEFIEYAVSKLNGIVGWLAYLGWSTRNKKILKKEDVDKVLEEAGNLSLSEFKRFLKLHFQAEKRYKLIMHAISREFDTWGKIKNYLKLNGEKITDKNLSNLLKNLQNAGFIEKKEKRYSITDPVLFFAIKKLG